MNEVDPIKTLTTARGKFIDERRSLAIAIALGYRRRRTDDPQTNEMGDTFVGLQNTIEAIDRAIAHEKAIATEVRGPASAFSEPSLVRTEVFETEGARQMDRAL
jgi:hypothetical protein